MAKVTVTEHIPVEPVEVFTLELSKREAMLVWGVLRLTSVEDDDGDPVWRELDAALESPETAMDMEGNIIVRSY
jgi:hypothetical protein